ncbi:MAG: response regulator transcription factor [Oscillospiraceae bacterium]|jgi:DNA-binding response OmpR family regulator|nr:response regulator transcription factor [Oscillospiraceae bacterium]
MRILIVEDDAEIAALVGDYLKIHGYDTALASDGPGGLALAAGGGFDLCVLDIMLPGMSGYEVLRELRERQCDIPVLILSAKSDEVDKIRALGLGADDFVQKPFSPGELVARVGAHLARYKRMSEKSAPRHRVISIRAMRVNLDTRQVFMRESEIALTGKEFDLLAFLAQNPNSVFSKDALFERVWGLDALGDAATVVVHIKKIREKTEEDPREPQYIETVWGAGYRLRV